MKVSSARPAATVPSGAGPHARALLAVARPGDTTPRYAHAGQKLIDSVRNGTVVTDSSALKVFDVQPPALTRAIARTIEAEGK